MKNKGFYLFGVMVCLVLVMSWGIAKAENQTQKKEMPEIAGALSAAEATALSKEEMDSLHGGAGWVKGATRWWYVIGADELVAAPSANFVYVESIFSQTTTTPTTNTTQSPYSGSSAVINYQKQILGNQPRTTGTTSKWTIY